VQTHSKKRGEEAHCLCVCVCARALCSWIPKKGGGGWGVARAHTHANTHAHTLSLFLFLSRAHTHRTPTTNFISGLSLPPSQTHTHTSVPTTNFIPGSIVADKTSNAKYLYLPPPLCFFLYISHTPLHPPFSYLDRFFCEIGECWDRSLSLTHTHLCTHHQMSYLDRLSRNRQVLGHLSLSHTHFLSLSLSRALSHTYFCTHYKSHI